MTAKLREVYSNKTRLAKHYRKESISRNPELRQTFLLILESLEHLDIDRLHSLDIVTPKRSVRPKHKSKKTSAKTSLRSTQLDLLDAVETVEERKPLGRSSSQPNIKIFHEEPPKSRRSSFPNNKDLLVDKSDHDLSSSNVLSTGFVKTHARARSDTAALLHHHDAVDGDTVSGGWSRVVPASTGSYPRPRANQSLLHFLSESVSMGRHGGRAELDRENAHFIMSETVISTFEQVRP